VFMTEDPRAARQLAAEKQAFRDLESAATRSHFGGLQDADGPSLALDLDLVRELKRVNGHLVAAAAYPVLEDQGELLSSRLRLDS
jgi:phosphate:Na+ symporter